ncbi:MAG TPA: DUF4118 domain-containing protein, partial [Bdellovibrionota bacterium]|nr:DUF4118 domain-containing protein [Bdellovibrionota bacterium]
MQRLLLAVVLAACTLVIGRQFWIFGTAAPFALPLLAGCLAAVTLGFRAAALTLIVSGVGIAALRFPELLGISLLQPHYVTQALLFLATSGLVLLLADRDERMRARMARQEEEARWLRQSWPGEDALFWRLDPG